MKIIFTLLLLLLNVSSFANINQPVVKILTFVSPLASLVKMIGGKFVEIENLTGSEGCIHHYHLKPSQLDKINKAEWLFILAKDFDGIILKKIPKKLTNIVYLTNNNQATQHAWLNITWTIQILNNISQKLSDILPEHKVYFMHNLAIHITKLQQLQADFNQFSKHNIIAATANLQPLLQNLTLNSNNILLLPTQQHHLKFSELSALQQYSQNSNKCIIIDEEYAVDKVRSILPKSVNIVTLNIEHWSPLKDVLLVDLYYAYLKQNFALLQACLVK